MRVPAKRPPKPRRPTKAEYAERASIIVGAIRRTPNGRTEYTPAERARKSEIEAAIDKWERWEMWPAFRKLEAAARKIRKTAAKLRQLRRELGL